VNRWPAVRRVPLLLWALVLAAATVGGIVAVAEIGAVWAVVLAGAALVAATVAMGLVVEGFLADEDDADAEPAPPKASS
jgi:hypothetical protein